jgi:hypothetical protein
MKKSNKNAASLYRKPHFYIEKKLLNFTSRNVQLQRLDPPATGRSVLGEQCLSGLTKALALFPYIACPE